jgi:hypothetical protein
MPWGPSARTSRIPDLLVRLLALKQAQLESMAVASLQLLVAWLESAGSVALLSTPPVACMHVVMVRQALQGAPCQWRPVWGPCGVSLARCLLQRQDRGHRGRVGDPCTHVALGAAPLDRTLIACRVVRK